MKWIQESSERKTIIFGPLIMAKADQFTQMLDVGDIKANEGWLAHLKKREWIVHKCLHGEAQSADEVSCERWLKEEWPVLSEPYAADDIYNADELDLYFRALPDSTLTFREDFAKGCKCSKEWITGLVACSMTGEKKKLLIIGKSKSPHCFKGVTLPVDYEANSSTWMTSSFFIKWLQAWDCELGQDKKKISLLVDNCSAHSDVDDNLVNINLKFLPPNTTSILQPCDGGIIRPLKAHYCHHLCLKTLECMDATAAATANDMVKKITLLDVILMLHLSWMNDVSPVTIRNCWQTCGLEKNEVIEECSGLSDVDENENIDFDSDLPTCRLSTDKGIIAEVHEEFREETDAEEDMEEEEVESPPSGMMRLAMG